MIAAAARFLVCRVSGRPCALPIEHVVETMRPLPVESLAGAPSFVRGVAVVRGVPLPVVDVGELLAGTESEPTRFVVVKTSDRAVALAVDSVLGVRTLAEDSLRALPSLLGDAREQLVGALGHLDAELLLVLRSARCVPEAVWSSLREHDEPR